MRSLYAGRPFATPTPEIAAALEDVSIPTLLLSLVHITGDPRFVRDFAPTGLFLNEIQGFMSEEDKARARTVALPVLAAYRDAGCPEPKPLSPELIREMMDWAACEHVTDEYLPLISEEMDLDGVDPRRPTALPSERAAELPVLVVDCGESGILAGIRLKQAGIPFAIVEKNAGPGGTWWENSYPGARGAWCVTLRSADGRTETTRARALITAVGQLNRPCIPDFAGAETFAGPAFHSSAWDHSVDVSGKRVALIGAGASGFQIAPAIAGNVGHLTVFQRTAQWMFPNPMYHDEVGDGMCWAMRHLPHYGRWYRFLVLWPGADKGLDAASCDADYPGRGEAVSDINAAVRMMFTQWITGQVGDDDELLAKVLPDYPACGKRTLQDNGSWLQTLRRDNVGLVRTPIQRITPRGVVTADGVTHDVDVIVYATGFRHTDVLWPLKITGRNGIDLHQMWGTRPYAHLGITVPNFPNLFIIYGPGTHLVHGGSLIFQSELQMRYVNRCLEHLAEADLHSLEPIAEAATAWHQRTQAEIQKMVWSHPAVKHTYFKNPDGEIHTVSPWRLPEYWAAIREPDWSQFIERAKEASTPACEP
ncbi:flavin-containing monooxygenase [Mycobacterium sp. THU-M104]|uniref:flavin-containing monooxygenase n=1 Tax=Mycobacterium sp. THU-M104 TaxID=3410515 RepID=UPI003B9D7606